jgi:hypothetical protein
VLPGALGDAGSAEHPRQFVYPRVTFQRLECGPGRAAVCTFLYADLPVCLRGDLRQVRHAQHLSRFGKRAELSPDHLRHGTADAGIHFVEHQARQVRRTQRRNLQRQADA